MCGCTNSIKKIKGISMKKYLKFKKISSVKSKDVMDTGLQMLIAISVFAIARLIHKMKWFQNLSASTQTAVDWGAILVSVGLYTLAEHPYIKTFGLAAALAAVYNKFGDEVDAQIKKIFNIAGWDSSMLSDGLAKRSTLPMVASPNGRLPMVACPPRQGF